MDIQNLMAHYLITNNINENLESKNYILKILSILVSINYTIHFMNDNNISKNLFLQFSQFILVIVTSNSIIHIL